MRGTKLIPPGIEELELNAKPRFYFVTLHANLVFIFIHKPL